MAKNYHKRKQRRKSDVIVLPSQEAQRHGFYIRQRVEAQGPKVARNTSIVPLEDCFQRGQITWGMYNAGLFFERLALSYRALIEAPTAGRDSCDFTVRGNTNETSVERALRIKESYLDALHVVEQAELKVLNSILIEHAPTGDRRDKYKRWSRFKDGLSALQKHWRIAENEKVA
jgi:hypothetical protein